MPHSTEVNMEAALEFSLRTVKNQVKPATPTPYEDLGECSDNWRSMCYLGAA